MINIYANLAHTTRGFAITLSLEEVQDILLALSDSTDHRTQPPIIAEFRQLLNATLPTESQT